MTVVTKTEIRHGVYFDSVILMELQASLRHLPGVSNVGVMMGLDTNKELLKQNDLLTKEAESAAQDDLIISIEGKDAEDVQKAFSEVDNLLSKRGTNIQQEYLPKTIEAAARMLPEAEWVLISVPGLYAAGVALEALRLNKNVFLYSDNVSLENEISLKQEAADRRLLLMGPDCGTAIINNVGFGFANKLRQGSIGVVAASGTGLQQFTSRIHQLGSGMTHAIGTGGRDLSEEVGGITARQALQLLQSDPDTKVIVLISKPPDPEVASVLLREAISGNKPTVVNFIGLPSPAVDDKGSILHFTSSLDETAKQAVKLATLPEASKPAKKSQPKFAESQCYLRGIFSGGTLAYESLFILRNYLPVIYSNIPLKKEFKLPDALKSQEHTIVDLGEDEFTVGRPHPMIDNSLRIERLKQEAADPEVAIILMDVVLGYGAHLDPAAELAPAISEARTSAKKEGRELEIVVIIVGTDEDPQDLSSQVKRLKAAGARVETNVGTACTYIGQRLLALGKIDKLPAVESEILKQPVKAINVGLESFAASLSAQNAKVIHVDWRPPAGGNKKLISILDRMKK
jgi:FdrA protein